MEDQVHIAPGRRVHNQGCSPGHNPACSPGRNRDMNIAAGSLYDCGGRIPLPVYQAGPASHTHRPAVAG